MKPKECLESITSQISFKRSTIFSPTMARFFSHYWSEKTFLQLKKAGDIKLDYTAGNQFVKRSVEKGDLIYVWSRVAGRLFLVGKIQVDRIMNEQNAQDHFPHDTLWPAKDHVLAKVKMAMVCRFDLEVPTDSVEKLRLMRADGPKPPVFNESGILDQQTLRGVIELTPETAQLMDNLLAKSAPPNEGPSVEVALNSLSKIQAETGTDEGLFYPTDITDLRQRGLASIVMRRGQAKFRQKLLQAYDSKCAITGCDAVEALEAAHIMRYQRAQTSQVSNGLLLRADIHTLFDLGLVAIDTSNMSVILHSSLARSCYEVLEGKALIAPQVKTSAPSKKALDEHRRSAGL